MVDDMALREWICVGLIWTASYSGGAAAAAEPIVIQGKLDTATEELLVPVQIAHTRFWCNLDSGYSALLALDRTKATRAGVVTTSAPDGQPLLPVAIASVTMSSQPVMIRDLPAEAPDMDCIMGMALLRTFVVELDYSSAKVRLYARDAYRPPHTSGAVPLIFRTNPNVPFIKVVVTLPDGSQQTTQTVVDSGASYYSAVFVSAAADALRAASVPIADPPQRPDSSRPGLTFVAARPRALTVGDFVVAQPVVALVGAGLGGGMDDGLLGVGFLRRFTAAFDYQGRHLYLTPNRRLRQEQGFDTSGASFRREAREYLVDRVLPDSPASRGGLRVGDRLIDIDGLKPNTLTPAQLRNWLSRANVTCHLHIERDGQDAHLALLLKRRL
jgi:hypothetical protein